jgi:fatty acid desaturase
MLMEDLGVQPGSRRPQRTDWRFQFDRWGFLCFWLGIAIVGVTTGIGWYLVLFWIVPYLTSFHIIGWFIELSEHCSSIEGRSTNVLMARNRSSRHFEKWLTSINNDGYHLDHHLDPTTPFWLLPRAHQIRLKDPVYAAHCAETGGLFQTGPDGAPSIISLLRGQNCERYRNLTRATPAAHFARPMANSLDHA